MGNTENLWPATDYYRQLEQLRAVIGQTLYIVEINNTDIQTGVRFGGKPLTLLAVVDYPQPDPYRQLCPHLLILDDGRGINLGHIARISHHTAFNPPTEDILYLNQEFVQGALLAPRTLSPASVAATSRTLLSQLFGDMPGLYLQQQVDAGN